MTWGVRLAAGIALVAALIHNGTPIHAQDKAALPVSASFIYNALIYNRDGTDGTRGGALRFAGRVAARLSPRTYVGFGAGSWLRVARPNCSVYPDCEDLLASQGEAVIYQGYVQRYIPRRGLFLRAGVGLAQTTTLLPGFPVLRVTRRWRAALGAGAGADVRIAELVYVTPSFDGTILPGADGAHELKGAFAFGLALTLR